jgi:hypothetical protein
MRPYLEKPFTKIELVEWLKVKALSSSPSTGKKKVFRFWSIAELDFHIGYILPVIATYHVG